MEGTNKRPINRDEPKLPPVAADFDAPPEELTGNAVALAEWARVVPLLRVSGVISQGERSALLALCVEWAHWIDAQAHLQAEGMLVAGKAGPTRNPYIRVANDCLKQLQRMWSELGLTPSSRARLHTGPQAQVPQVASKWGGDL